MRHQTGGNGEIVSDYFFFRIICSGIKPHDEQITAKICQTTFLGLLFLAVVPTNLSGCFYYYQPATIAFKFIPLWHENPMTALHPL